MTPYEVQTRFTLNQCVGSECKNTKTLEVLEPFHNLLTFVLTHLLDPGQRVDLHEGVGNTDDMHHIHYALPGWGWGNNMIFKFKHVPNI